MINGIDLIELHVIEKSIELNLNLIKKREFVIELIIILKRSEVYLRILYMECVSAKVVLNRFKNKRWFLIATFLVDLSK
jgi:hypothetical protein